MQKPLKLTAFLLVGALVVLLSLTLVVNKVSITQAYRIEEVPVSTVLVPTDPVWVERGAHLAQSVVGCTHCHGADLGGKILRDERGVVTIAAANLTRGAAQPLDVQEMGRAVRYGVAPNGRVLWCMPRAALGVLNDTDLGAILAYLKTAPNVRRTLPANRLYSFGRVQVALGRLTLVSDPPTSATLAQIRTDSAIPGPSVAYGRYLANIAHCTSCHGESLRGSPGGSSDITKTGLADWHPSDLVHVLREGKKPDGSEVDAGMPWRHYRDMSDIEIEALWAFLQTLA